MREGTLVAWDGQSLNNGPGPGQTFPYLVMAGLGLPWTTTAVSGKSWTVLTGSAVARVDHLVTQYRPQRILCLTGGTSDLIAPESNDAATAKADLDAYVAARRAAGWDTILVATVTPSHYMTAGEEAERVAFNDLLRADTTTYDGLADLAAHPDLDDRTDVTFYEDGTHFTAAGAVAAASVWSETLSTVGIAPPPAQVALVQEKSYGPQGGGSFVFTFDAAPAPGNLVVAAMCSRHTYANDTKPPNLTELAVGINASENDYTQILAGISDGTNAFQWMNAQPNDDEHVYLAEYSGDWSAVVLEDSGARARTSDAGGVFTSLAIAQPCLVVAAMTTRSNTTGAVWSAPLVARHESYSNTNSTPMTSHVAVSLEQLSSFDVEVALPGTSVNFAAAAAIRRPS